MNGQITTVHYWAGCPKSANSKWQRFLAIVRRCAEESWQNYLVLSAMPANTELTKPFEEAGCQIVCLPRSHGNCDLGSIWRVYRLLRRLRCDIFHCHNDHTSPLVGATLAHVPIRIWSKLAMSSCYEQGISPNGMHRFEPSTCLSGMLAHKVHTVSDAVRQELLDLGVPSDRVQTIRCPVDLSRYSSVDGSAFRNELGSGSADLLLTAVGHAVPVKGWDVLVRACGEVASQFPQTRVALVGSIADDGERGYAAEIKKLVQASGLAGRIELVGRRSDIPACLAGSDVFVLPSRSEGQPLALMEAMASGLPCVAAAVGGVPETIAHGEDGLLFERENVGQLAEQLRRVLSDGALRRRLGAAAKEVSRAFGIDTYVDAMFSMYCSLLESRGRRRPSGRQE